MASAVLMGGIILLWRIGRAKGVWLPATRDDSGRPLYDEARVLQLCIALLRQPELEYRGDLPAETEMSDPYQTPELRLAMEAIPEAISEYMLRNLGLPKSHDYILQDERGNTHQFDLRAHPVFAPLMKALQEQLVPAEFVRALANSSAYTDVYSRAMNAGDSLAGAAVVFAPLGLGLRGGKLYIKEGQQ